MNKKIFRLISEVLAAVTLISTAAIPSMAAAPDLTVKVDGKVIDFPDQEPTIVKDRTLVPVRFIAENLGYDVEWDKDANAAVIDNGRIVLYIGTDQAKIDGKAVTLDVASTLINDRTMVPLRVVAETLNCTVDWFGTNRMILVNKRESDGSEKSVFERYKQSDLFWQYSTTENEYLVWKADYATLAEASAPSTYHSWWIESPIDKSTLVNQSFDCSIIMKTFDQEELANVRDMLFTPYPTGNAAAYEIMMDTITGEIWETFYPDTSEWYPLFSGMASQSGTFGTHYYDDREVEMYCNDTCTQFILNINDGWKEWRLDNGLEVLVPENFRTTEDGEGNHYIYPCGDCTAMPSGKMSKNGYYFDNVSRQIPFEDEDELNPEDNLEEFGYTSDEVLDEFAEDITAADRSGRGVLVNFGGTGLGDAALVPGPGLKNPKGIRDVAEWYMATAAMQDYVRYIFDLQTDIALVNLAKLNERAGDRIDVIFICGTDFGTQNSTFCSAETYRSLYMPYYRKVNDWVHRNTRWKTFKHCCGAIEPFIPLFVESGFDILNPVQCSAAGMDPATLKQKYGKDIVFWGGGVDTQKTLPFGTPEQVREQVKERCEIFGKDGGFVFNAIHNVQANTPVENIAAMFDALREINRT